jgi:hypothetical protein
MTAIMKNLNVIAISILMKVMMTDEINDEIKSPTDIEVSFEDMKKIVDYHRKNPKHKFKTIQNRFRVKTTATIDAFQEICRKWRDKKAKIN